MNVAYIHFIRVLYFCQNEEKNFIPFSENYYPVWLLAVWAISGMNISLICTSANKRNIHTSIHGNL